MVSQEPYIIWSSFLVHLHAKRIKSPGFFSFFFKILIIRIIKSRVGQGGWFLSPANIFIFQNFDSWGFLGGERAKNDLKLQIWVCFALNLRNCSSSRTYSCSLLHLIIICNHLPSFKVFSNFVHFCPNFQIICPFLPFFCPFSEKLRTCPYFLE